jgi:hypothetical protein
VIPIVVRAAAIGERRPAALSRPSFHHSNPPNGESHQQSRDE